MLLVLSSLVGERIRILDILSLEDKMKLKDLAEKLGISLGRTLGLTTNLVKKGYIRKVGSAFSLSRQGRVALKELRPIRVEEGFRFYVDIGEYTGLTAYSLEDFLENIGKVDVKSIEFHTSRGDFEKWIRDVFHDRAIEQEITRIRETELKGETLRSKIREVVYAKLKSLMEEFP